MKKQIKFYYVYLITNLVLNKLYIGSRICYKDKIDNDIYWGSSKYLNRDYEIYGIENFTKKILKTDYANAKDMLIGESSYMHEYNTFEPKGYNKWDPAKNPGFYAGMTGKYHSEETKQKIRNNRRNISGENNPMFGIEWPEEKKNKMREKNNPMFGKEPANKGKPRSIETINKVKQKTKESMHKPENWGKFIKNNREGKARRKLHLSHKIN